MSKLVPLITLFIALISQGCSHREHNPTPVLAKELSFKSGPRIFETSNGRRIKLVLGEDDPDQKEHADIPRHSFRGHTTSFYQDLATKRILAESGISKNVAWQLENLEIREASDGIILITEDLSDALPGHRYILIHHDSVRYLSPAFDSNIDDSFPEGSFRKVGHETLQLLKNGNIDHGGKEEIIDSLTSSTTPFSVGG